MPYIPLFMALFVPLFSVGSILTAIYSITSGHYLCYKGGTGLRWLSKTGWWIMLGLVNCLLFYGIIFGALIVILSDLWNAISLN